MADNAATLTVLDQILAYKRDEVAARRRALPLADLQRQADALGPSRGFKTALDRAAGQGRWGLIAEIKKASPSKGLIREDFDPPQLAKAYQGGGAACLSILTDTPSFQGHDSYLKAVSEVVDLPLLRKDFFIDPYQVYEAKALGADCILIIMAAVENTVALALADAARAVGLDCLWEVHNDEELDRALECGATLIGINNRDLKTFETSLEVSERLAPKVPEACHVVGESGLSSPQDLLRLSKVGINSFLIGESLMREADVEAATRRLLQRPATSKAQND